MAAADWLDREAVIQAARTIARDNYPNANDVLVGDLIRARYSAPSEIPHRLAAP